MIAITLSSSASLRTPTTACSGLPAVSKEMILSFLPLIPPAALISSTAIWAAISFVRANVANGPAPANRFPSRISCACTVLPVTADSAVTASNPKILDFIALTPLSGSTDSSRDCLALLCAPQVGVAQRWVLAQIGRRTLHYLAPELQHVGPIGEF